MDLLSAKWLSELEMDDSGFIHQWQNMSSIENSVENFSCNIFSSNNNMTNPSSTLKSAPHFSQIKQVEQKQWKPCISDQKASSSSSIISFGNPDPPRASAHDYGADFYVKPEMKPVESISLENIDPSSVSQIFQEIPYGLLEFGDGVSRSATRKPSQAQEHVLAERKRRERMTQRFIALSSVIPGLKKLDKTTVLGDAINYIKKLQERVKKLEEELKSKNEESIVSVKRPRVVLSAYDDGSSCSANFDGSSDQSSSPEIEVRASEGNVLVRVYCKNQTGIIKQIFSEIERHDHLSIVSSSVMPFGDNRLHITIISQMADQYNLTATTTMIDNLRMAIANLI